MILTPAEYAEAFKFQGKKVSTKTVIRRCMKGMLPKGHEARKIPGTRNWVISVNK